MILFHCRWERSASRFARGALFSPVALAVFIVLLFAMDSAVGLGLTLPKRWDGLQSLCGSLSIPSAKFLNLAEPPLAGGTHSCEVTWPQSYAPPHSVSCRGAGGIHPVFHSREQGHTHGGPSASRGMRVFCRWYTAAIGARRCLCLVGITAQERGQVKSAPRGTS